MPSSGNTPPHKPRLLIILNRFVIGGQAVDTIPLAWYLKKDFEILILYGEKEKDEIEPQHLLEKYPGLSLKKIKFLKRSLNPFNDILAFFFLVIHVITFKPHIVHTHGAKSGFLGRSAAWVCGVPVIIHTFHGHFFHSYFPPFVSRSIAAVEKAIGKITTAVIALSSAQKNELADNFKILPASKITIIPLGFDFVRHENAAARLAFRNKFGLQSHDVAIGIVGRLVPIKNHSFFVSVIQQILALKANENAAFFIIGDGDLRSAIEKELLQKNINYNNKSISSNNRVVFTSWITDMYEVMNGLDIVALTSRNEGTPLSVIEAQFFQKPVVSTNVGGVKDTLQNNVTGFLVAEGDIPTFCKKLSLLINDKDVRKTMGTAGYQFASAAFSKQKEVATITDFYFSLLQQKGYSFIDRKT